MQTSQCQCGNRLFFGSTKCVKCGLDVGRCEHCHEVTPVAEKQGATHCGRCQRSVRPCANRTEHQVCNLWTAADETSALCRYCRLSVVIPDLSVEGNLQRWQALEMAKRRVLSGIHDVGFPYDGPATEHLPLTFQFKADGPKPVATGHANGCITINLREADPVERERARVAFGEPQRTLVGHFRHELGHYYWQLLVQPQRIEEFREIFGDERNPTYEEAKDAYYRDGPRDHWKQNYISAYASMHPWEDFAESFGAFMDLFAATTTAAHFGLLPQSPAEGSPFDALLKNYQRIGVVANELNRDMGLLDLVPEVFHRPIREKLKFIHSLPGTASD